MWYHMQVYCVWNQNADHKCIGLLTFPSILYECINQASFFYCICTFSATVKTSPIPRPFWPPVLIAHNMHKVGRGGGGEGLDHNNAFHPCISCVLCTMTSGIARILKLPRHRGCTLSREARKNFSPSFFSYQDGLLWHLRTLHCKQPLLIKVSWRAWHCWFALRTRSIDYIGPHGIESSKQGKCPASRALPY